MDEFRAFRHISNEVALELARIIHRTMVPDVEYDGLDHGPQNPSELERLARATGLSARAILYKLGTRDYYFRLHDMSQWLYLIEDLVTLEQRYDELSDDMQLRAQAFRRFTKGCRDVVIVREKVDGRGRMRRVPISRYRKRDPCDPYLVYSHSFDIDTLTWVRYNDPSDSTVYYPSHFFRKLQKTEAQRLIEVPVLLLQSLPRDVVGLVMEYV